MVSNRNLDFLMSERNFAIGSPICPNRRIRVTRPGLRPSLSYARMRTLYLLSALPGSGKSTWARRFKENHNHVYVVSSDEIRIELFGRADDFSNEELTWSTFLQRIHFYGEQDEEANVIADSTNLTNYFREYYRLKTPEFDKHILVVFDIPLEDVFAQNRMRKKEKIVPDEAMRKMAAQYEPLSQETADGFDEVIHIGPDFIAEELRRQKEKAGR